MQRFRLVAVFAVLCIIGILWQVEYLSQSHYFLKFPTSPFRKDDIPNMRKRSQMSNDQLDEDAYQFLYGDEFEKALDRAEQKPKKVILFWHPDGDNSMTFSADLSRECGGCLVREDKNLINDEKTEAVIILFDYTVPAHRPKVKRNPKQYWIWRCAEAPPYMRRGNWLNIADEMKFNKTFTYRFDSDFFLPYGNTLAETGTELENPLANKEHLILIAVSNCGMTPGAKIRMKYLKELKKAGLRINMFGRCFNDNRIKRMDVTGMLEYMSRHKFYFSFENSYHCKDYVTEKFFRPIKAGTVPVVWGATRKTYETYLPRNGFIYLEDFPTMQNFIDHLNYLDNNDTAYLEYFRWRTERHHHPRYKQQTGVCQMCRFLHGINVDDAYKVDYKDLQKNQSFITDGPKPAMTSSIKKWWNEDDNPECYAKLELNENGTILVT